MAFKFNQISFQILRISDNELLEVSNVFPRKRQKSIIQLYLVFLAPIARQNRILCLINTFISIVPNFVDL